MFFGPGGPARMFGQETLKPKNLSETLGRFGKYFAAYWPLLILAAVFVIAATWMQVTTPEMIGQVVDCYLAPALGPVASGFSVGPGSTTTTTIPDNCWLASDSADTSPMQAQLRNLIYTGATVPTRGDLAALSTGERIAGLGRVILTVIGLYVGGAILTGLSFFTMSWAGQGVLRNMRVDVFRHLHRLPQGYYAEHEAGD